MILTFAFACFVPFPWTFALQRVEVLSCCFFDLTSVCRCSTRRLNLTVLTCSDARIPALVSLHVHPHFARVGQWLLLPCDHAQMCPEKLQESEQVGGETTVHCAHVSDRQAPAPPQVHHVSSATPGGDMDVITGRPDAQMQSL